MLRQVLLACFVLSIVLPVFAADHEPAFDKKVLGFDPAKVNWERMSKIPMKDLFIKQYQRDCAVCHGDDLRGANLGTPLVGVPLRHGETVEEIANSIAKGFPERGMPAWSQTLKPKNVWALALYIAEQRQGTTILDKRADIPLEIPQGIVESELHDFTIEVVAKELDAMPFSIEPLPDGRILLSERMRGLRIINTDGTVTDYIKGTPEVFDDAGQFLGQVNGVGWMLDVALHPDFEKNGWVYIHHTDRCSDCNDLSRRSGRPVSMNRLVRGKIQEGRWVDQQIIWQAEKKTYTDTSDLASGGRIAFDENNHVYISVGFKAPMDFVGIQDLSWPYGKIHRVHDDGRIPEDNPFVDHPTALKSIWSYGHRSIQGLEYDPVSKSLWNSEMGPRGGDEVNRVIKGGNFGWPIFTSGVNYDGRPVDVADKLGVDIKREDTQFPVLDMTPSPAISSFIFYDANEFSQWKNQMIIGTLRATDLWRLQIKDNKVVHKEVLLEDLARFRDIELGFDGKLYLLLENKSGSQVIRLDAKR